MARRKTIIATNETYHIYNRGVEKRPIFLNKRDYSRFMDLITYYRFMDCPVKFSRLKQLSLEKRERIINNLQKNSKTLVDIYAYCLMQNHVHFLLKQNVDKGITKFIAKITNGYSHYFNTRHERVGHLFQGNFGAVRIEDDEQLLHVSRYIHLNPVTSYIIELKNLESYSYSSYPEYIDLVNIVCNTEPILAQFSNAEAYKKFVHDQAEYARELKNIEHLIIENDRKRW